jgi:hypothetical protein
MYLMDSEHPLDSTQGDMRDVLEKVGGAEEIRTLDLCIANAALSQLSYSPTVVIFLKS